MFWSVLTKVLRENGMIINVIYYDGSEQQYLVDKNVTLSDMDSAIGPNITAIEIVRVLSP